MVGYNLKIAILPNLSKNDADIYAQKLIKKVLSLGSKPMMLEKQGKYFNDNNIKIYKEMDELISDCDTVITIGGDGTIIHKAKYAAKFSKPILGLNLGRVGFVAELEKTEIDEIENLVEGKYEIENRAMLYVNITHKIDSFDIKEFYALNDVVISKSAYSGVVDLNVFLNGNKMNRYIADGIILSTPTGSTAYSLSAGGPIIEPKLDCILLTPICQHSMLSRSVIFNRESKIDINTSLRRKDEVFLSVDGRDTTLINDNNTVSISLSDTKVKLIKLKKYNFYEVLDQKFSKRYNISLN